MLSKTFTLVALLSIVPACSLSTFDRKSCESNKECRDELGFGHVCVEDGYCDVAVLNPRCTHTYPENLLSDPAEREGRVIIGSVLEQNVARHSAREHAAETAIAVTDDEGGASFALGAIFCTVEENYNPDGMGGDGLSRADATIAMGRHLIDMYGVPAIFGPNLSGDTTALFNELNSNGDDVIIMSPSATAVCFGRTPRTLPSTSSVAALKCSSLAPESPNINVIPPKLPLFAKAISVSTSFSPLPKNRTSSNMELSLAAFASCVSRPVSSA